MLMQQAQGTDVIGLIRTQRPELIACVLEGTLYELEKLATGSSKTARNALLAHKIAQQHLKILSQSIHYVDDALIAYAREHKSIILTRDRQLQKRARQENIAVLTLAANSKLHVVA